METHIEYICIKEDPDGSNNDKNSVYRIVPRLEAPVPTSGIASTPISEKMKVSPPDTTSNSSPCLPSNITFTGQYGFSIYFEPLKAESRKMGWVYSESLDKLYAAKDMPCPISFRTERAPPSNTKIRVTAVFAQPEYANEVVRRCINHSFIDLNNGVINPDHLIRCECDQAVYETDDGSDRRSVVLPYEHPSRDQQYSTYIFKFVCFGSCAGGLNRRPIRVIFTLEVNKQIIGRRSLDVKICACPWRDSRNENEKQGVVCVDEPSGSSHHSDSSTKKRKKKDSDSTFTDIIDFVKEIANGPTAKKCKSPAPDENGTYAIIVHDPEEYEFLKQVKKLYELSKTMQSVPPEVLRYLKSIQKRKKEFDS